MLQLRKTYFDSSYLVETECGDCYIRVSTWREDGENGGGEVQVELVSNHNTLFRSRLRDRLKRAWGILRYRYIADWFVFIDPKVVDDLIASLRAAREDTWGAPAATDET